MPCHFHEPCDAISHILEGFSFGFFVWHNPINKNYFAICKLFSCNMRILFYILTMKHLKQAFQLALAREDIRLKAFAGQRDINPARISEFLHRNKTLAGDLKACIFIGWKNPAITITLFDAHIQDELDAAGLSLSITYNLK